MVFAQKQLHFVLLAALEAINTSKFTQLLSWMKFRPQCPNMCCVRSTLLARERKLAQLCDVVRAYCRHPGKGLAHSVHSTEHAYRRIACLPWNSSCSKNLWAPISTYCWIQFTRFCREVRNQILILVQMAPIARAECEVGSLGIPTYPPHWLHHLEPLYLMKYRIKWVVENYIWYYSVMIS